jgi:hypothetical protein
VLRAHQLVLTAVLACVPAMASGQATWQPTPAPTTTAENEAWYRNAEPIPWGDTLYYQAGATVFFNRYQMVRSGAYRGIQLYTDSTQDPFGIIYVPIAGGLMQPYERRRTGDLAGTTGNRAPSFPVAIGAEAAAEQPAIPTTEAVPEEPSVDGLTAVAMTGRSIVEAPRGTAGSVARPVGINGVWITYEGQRWFAGGKAVRLDPSFAAAGRYHGFPIYRRSSDERIYLPTAEGMVAPYTRRPQDRDSNK